MIKKQTNKQTTKNTPDLRKLQPILLGKNILQREAPFSLAGPGYSTKLIRTFGQQLPWSNLLIENWILTAGLLSPIYTELVRATLKAYWVMWGGFWERFRTKRDTKQSTLNLKSAWRRKVGIAPLLERKYSPLPEKCLPYLKNGVDS